MGVRGLTSFLEDNGHILQDVHFKNSKLLIDAANLYNCLYLDLGLDHIHGGEYDAFAALAKRFIEALRTCGIDPYVVLDGGADYTDKKFDTKMKKAEKKIQRAHKMSMGHGGQLLPSIIEVVFIQVLTALNVPFGKCTVGKADREIASLAKEWNCPVLSSNGGFFIFDIPAGFLPISHFRWQQHNHPQKQSYGPEHPTTERFIPAKLFTAAKFCSHFNIDRSLLPVFAAIARNDYTKISDKGLILRWGKYSRLSGRFARLDGLLHWLGGFQMERDALEALFGIIGDFDVQEMADIQQCLSFGIEKYKLPQRSSLGGYFAEGTSARDVPVPLKVLPDWALENLTRGKLSTFFLVVLLFERVILKAIVEDARLPSGNITSRGIRQVAYGLLLDGEGRTQCTVEEYHRDGLELTSHMVQPVRSEAVQRLQLETMDKEPQSVRLKVFLETLGVSQNHLWDIPDHLCLPVSVTCYWMSHAHPPPDPPLLQALLLGLVYGEFCRQKISQRRLSMEELVLERLRGLALGGRGRGLDMEVVHAYSQWQTCLKEALGLNQLLCFPLAEPQCAALYKGTLVHRLVAQLREGTTPSSLLTGGPGSGHLYKAMLDTVLHSQESQSILSRPMLDTVLQSQESLSTLSSTKPMVDPSDHLQKLVPQLNNEEEEDARRGKMKNTPGEGQSWVKVSCGSPDVMDKRTFRASFTGTPLHPLQRRGQVVDGVYRSFPD